MHYTPPASSAYAPSNSSRALILRTNTHTKQGHKHKKSAALLILYLLLKFWDKPLLQKIVTNIVSQWTTACEKNSLLHPLVQSQAGIVTGKAAKKVSYYFIRFLIQAIQRSRVDRAGWFAVQVPNSIQTWAAKYESSARTNGDGGGMSASARSIGIHSGNRDSRTTTTTRSILLNNSNSDRIVEERGFDTSLQTSNHTPAAAMDADTNMCIDQVLKYWFGQFNPEKSQKQLWMIASSSKDHLQKVDAEITELFGPLLTKLSSPQSSDLRDVWCCHGWRGYVAAIIVLDQMSRHIHRHYKTMATTGTDLLEQQSIDEFSYAIAQDFQKTYAAELACGMIPIPMMIFALMPLRHKSTLQSVGYVQSQVEHIAQC